MKKALFVLLLLAPALAWATKPTASSADYTIAVHVQSSRITLDCSGGLCNWTQELTVLIGGKKYELYAGSVQMDVLRVGNYNARIIKDETTRDYEYARTYEFLFADGKTRQYRVIGESE